MPSSPRMRSDYPNSRKLVIRNNYVFEHFGELIGLIEEWALTDEGDMEEKISNSTPVDKSILESRVGPRYLSIVNWLGDDINAQQHMNDDEYIGLSRLVDAFELVKLS